MRLGMLGDVLQKIVKLGASKRSFSTPDMQRRSLSIAALSLPIAAGIKQDGHVAIAAAKPTPDRHATVLLSAPRDCRVVNIIVRDNVLVNKDDIVINLDTDDEDRSLSRIELARKFLSLQEAALSDDQIEIRRRVLQDTADTADAYVMYANLMLQHNDEESKVGQVLTPTVNQAEAALIRATAESKRASSAVDLFNFNIKQAKSRLEIVQEQLAKEQGDVIERKSRMSVRSPVSGRITLKVYVGAFLLKGSPLAEIS